MTRYHIADDDSMFRQLAEIKERLARLELTTNLGHSSIEDGAIEDYDASGTLRQIIGKQFDGTHVSSVVNSPKPPAPATLTVTVSPGMMQCYWPGDFVYPPSTQAFAPMDFARTEIYRWVSSELDGLISYAADKGWTLDQLWDAIFIPDKCVGEITTAAGGIVTVGVNITDTYVVVAIARTLSGRRSDSPGGYTVAAEGPADPTQVQEAIDTANGKNKVTHSTVDPPDPAEGTETDGDLWYKYTDDTVVGQWRFVSGAWVASVLDNLVIAAIDAGKITTGILAAGTKITAGSPTGSHVEIDSTGIRKYADDGTSIDVDLSSSEAVFSGIVTGSDIIGGRFRTATTGARVEIDTWSGYASRIQMFTAGTSLSPALIDTNWIPIPSALGWLLLRSPESSGDYAEIQLNSQRNIFLVSETASAMGDFQVAGRLAVARGEWQSRESVSTGTRSASSSLAVGPDSASIGTYDESVVIEYDVVVNLSGVTAGAVWDIVVTTSGNVVTANVHKSVRAPFTGSIAVGGNVCFSGSFDVSAGGVFKPRLWAQLISGGLINITTNSHFDVRIRPKIENSTV